MAFSIDADIRPPGHGGRRAVIADADRMQRQVLAGHLSARGFQVSQTEHPLEALTIIGAEAPAVALLPLGREGDDGDRAAALAAMLFPQTRILLTGRDLPNAPFPVLPNPVDLSALDRWLDEATA
ncbi:response regulator [Azospirillum picis]|uniref:CheY-like chemotaxis protein n=1 Tax=Azospirillum picis TaxID=488438 RepID=A0ABU0MPA8_9PROT|nr:response regulator [Azospirillum picis]MBP2301470.1 CheY-like chemotaxis protein [Azospirillum picis]MDQ0535302.1 CheY-like chemotaxis protein [Azospirillum picis]